MTYSRAFESLVENEDDLSGLLAYALYKKTVREKVQQGQVMSQAVRNLTRSEIRLHKEYADSLLAQYAMTVVEQAKDNIADAHIQQVVELQGALLSESEGRIIDKVKESTSWKSAVLFNVIGWLVTLGISALVVLNAPEWLIDLLK